MAAILLSDRSSKKQRSSPARSFISSPQAVQKSEALRWKHTKPDHFQLRYISSGEISVETAAQDSPAGFDICVSPQSGSGSNEFFKGLASQQQKFQDMEQRLSTVELYMNALYTSVEMCAADLPMFTLYILDYHLRRIFKDRKCNHANPKEYQSLFVGKGKGKPFKGTAGDQIRYIFLLSCMLRLEESMQPQEDKDGDFDGEDLTEKLSAFDSLLLGAEECLIATITYCGIEPPTAVQIREDCVNFLQGAEKKGRDSAAHLFCDMFFQQRRTPFKKLWLRDTIFPPENYSLFPKDNSALSAENLMRLGLKVIALIDIEKRMNAPSLASYALHTVAPLITNVGLQLVKYFIKTKGKFMCSMQFKYGALTATLEIDQTKPPKVVDLGSMKGLAISA